MTTDDSAGALRERLAAATRHVSAPSGIAERAVAGGRRRLRRRRVAEGLATTAVAAAVAVAVVLPLASRDAAERAPGPSRQTAPTRNWTAVPPSDADVLRWLYDRPPRGDLAGDAAYLRRVIDLWDSSHARSPNAIRGVFRDLRGPSRVVWAGRTPAGPAALVVQRAMFSEGEGVVAGAGSVVGFVGVGEDGQPRLVTDGYRDRRGEPGFLAPAWFVDPGRSVVAVLDLGVPVAWAQGWRYHANGVRDLGWKPLAFRNGAATVRVDGSRWWDVHVARRPYDEPASDLLVARSGGAPPDGTKLEWGDGDFPTMRIAGLAAGDLPDAEATFVAALNARIRGTERGGGYPRWRATGRMADGTEIVVADLQLDSDPSHAYAVLSRGSRTSVVHGGPVDPDAPLPVVVRLPDDRGTVVAREGARLEWRSGAEWQEAGTGAALLPPSATEVRVTPVDSAPVEVTLPPPSR
jgi:hypothetical protein